LILEEFEDWNDVEREGVHSHAESEAESMDNGKAVRYLAENENPVGVWVLN